ncbi:hypothetical protein [Jiella marina]|uniref:hypothetical protein n=1 Tax=Jiella sp. LLJ827 TaxID=2917712 RepID=UPI00210116AF|nr:hypothetical protein [Jiella sp. LLJ827]MCQ0990538.1 hypothetical protein [Jiella sp. LLJ827]
MPQAGDLDGPRIAVVSSLRPAYAVLDLAKRDHPRHVLLLRRGARIVCRHEPDLI